MNFMLYKKEYASLITGQNIHLIFWSQPPGRAKRKLDKITQFVHIQKSKNRATDRMRLSAGPKSITLDKMINIHMDIN
jgi:hypothetical protein